MKIEKLPDGNYFGKLGREERIIPTATPEMVTEVEAFIYKECSPYLNKMYDMTDEAFESCINHIMWCDHKKGIYGDHLPPIIYEHNQWFKDFEIELSNQINKRMRK